MANVIIRTAEQNAHEAFVLASYGVRPNEATKEQREYAQEIARRSKEIERGMK